MLKIAIQKSGRLYEDSVKLLKECGIELNNGNKQLKTVAFNFPLEVYFLRDDDIPQYVYDGVADIGIVGENVLLEKNKDIELLYRLGFGRCRLSIAVPKAMKYDSVNDLKGLKIATTYSGMLQQYLAEKKVDAEIHEISGSVEIAPGIGLADAICDLVSSGSTLFTNGLKEVETILQSEAVLVTNKKLPEEKKTILQKLLLRINAVKTAKNNKYILLNAPNHQLGNIFKLLPGMKSPTVVNLAEEGWSSVQSVVNENDFWDVIEKLKQFEAEGIIVIPIEKMIV
ncbi:ATP phosphoribosyltransferase [Ferruginibacter sp. HRS2-29]|uniref:ATP phosphoribosyltransferase n=1 Tax=Ferruginibacter sp. HRS2-29 TaxID=2487334 RepID=UPI0020CD5224|nr:ATP phosphoribosyltransferase [Ferruginibacter sp. HRS2-29]MCP9749874.1 ATP phosphoribosyltransferase [Ferruginibacter sp. HRS2-29]